MASGGAGRYPVFSLICAGSTRNPAVASAATSCATATADPNADGENWK